MKYSTAVLLAFLAGDSIARVTSRVLRGGESNGVGGKESNATISNRWLLTSNMAFTPQEGYEKEAYQFMKVLTTEYRTGVELDNIYVNTKDVDDVRAVGPFPATPEEFPAFVSAVKQAQGKHSSRHRHTLEQECGSQTVYVEFRNDKKFFDVPVTAVGEGVEPFLFATLRFPSYIYSDVDKDEILQRLRDDHMGYSVKFVTELPESFECASVLSFNGNEGSSIELDYDIVRERITNISILFGRAQSIDFLNKITSDFAFIDANFWTFYAQFASDPESSFERLTGIPIDESTTLSEAVRMATINQVSRFGSDF